MTNIRAKMAKSVFLLAFSALIIFGLTKAHEDFATEIIKRFERLEAQCARVEEKNRAEIDALNDKYRFRETELIRKIGKLNKRVSVIEKKNSELTREVFRLQQRAPEDIGQERGNDKLDTIEDENANQTVGAGNRKAVSKIRQATVGPRVAKLVDKKQAPPSLFNVAFSAYLDHAEDGLGDMQTLVFNKVLLNDGNGYSKYTGVFSVPVSGVYCFTFFIGQRDVHQQWAGLFVNNVNQVEAAVETTHTAEDAQGGNSAVVKVTAGDMVVVKVFLHNRHIEGTRLTTFSGFLLYPTGTGAVSVIG